MERTRKNLIWRHNGFFGNVRRAYLAMWTIMNSETATDKAKIKAHIILNELEELKILLKQRKEINL